MVKHNEYFPESVPHPGVTLAEKLEELGIGYSAFAIKNGLEEKKILAIIKGESPITSQMAIQLEKALKIPAHFWLNNQHSYDEYMTRKKAKAAIASNTIITNLPHSAHPSHSSGLRNIK